MVNSNKYLLGMIWLIKPIFNALSASNCSQSNSNSAAFTRPTKRDSSKLEAASGTKAKSTKGNLNLAVLSA